MFNKFFHIKEVFMKKTRYLSFLVSLLLASALIFSGCSNDDDDKSTTPGSDPGSEQGAEADKTAVFDSVDDAAFTVLRSLTDLTQYDPEKVTDEDGSVSGIETLPETWSALTFPCDEGFVLNETKETVRSLPVNGFGDALEFFSGVIGEAISEESLTNGTYSWSYSGLGSLTFKKASGSDDNLYATLDVNIPVISNLTQLSFISTDSPELTSANSYKGLPYYHAGDVIRRNKDHTYWICVRPSGGPYKKDKSYWISLDAFDNKSTGKNAGKTTIKSDETKVEVYYDVNQDGESYELFKQTWVYAKNLMSLKTAKAAFHTFSAIVDSNVQVLEGYENADKICKALKDDHGIDLLGLHPWADDSGQIDSEGSAGRGVVIPAYFKFAYGTPKNESNRGIKLDRPARAFWGYDAKVFKTAGQVKKVQPFMTASGTVANGKLVETIVTKMEHDIENSSSSAKPFLLSLTDSFDTVYWRSISSVALPFDRVEGSTGAEKASNYLYDFKNYLHGLDSPGGSKEGPLRFANNGLAARYLPQYLDVHVIVSPELVITDNKGNENTEKRPVGTEYSDIYLQETNCYFDYWATFDNCERSVDGKKVDWQKENKE